MDYHQDDDNQSWAWQGDDVYLLADAQIEDISCMFEETTPVKCCGDLAYYFDDRGEANSKSPREGKEYASQIKRRRILEFDCDEEIPSCCFKSKERGDAHSAVLREVDACFQEFLPPTIEDFRQSEAWLAECLNDSDLNISSDDGNVSSTSGTQISVNEVSDENPDSGSSMVHRPVRSFRNIILKGRKSYMKTPSETPSSIVYPFDIIKPCGIHGDVTLEDINHRIHSPLPLKPKEDSIYPTSAFSGKPVVGKTKIPTKGGKGSITIMRTKG